MSNVEVIESRGNDCNSLDDPTPKHKVGIDLVTPAGDYTARLILSAGRVLDITDEPVV